MRLSWSEIRVRAAAFAREWADASYEKGETQSFYNDFFSVFGVRRRDVARFEERVDRLDNTRGYIDLFWPGMLLVEQKSAGRSLEAAREQAGDYFDALPERSRPRYQLLCDFQTFELLDRDEREEWRFALADLPDHIDKFGFILGVEKRTFRDQDPVNIEAAELMGALHDALKESGYGGHDLEQFLVRTVFCLFADNTGIFDRDSFLHLVEERSSEDGATVGGLLTELFQVLDTPEHQRLATRDEDIARFPYVNGDLFRDPLRMPAFNASMRELLIEACRFDWSKVSPAIFGSLFQSVMEPEERRAQGAHYTTERNILKVIEPLFLDDLRAEFERLRARRDTRRRVELERFHRRLGEMTFFDPACGCGNFLIIAYRELRTLEIDVIRELIAGQQVFNVADLTRIDVDQFYGIELNEFPARIAETALWMMDHIMNNRTQPGVRRGVRAHPAAGVAAHPARGRARNGLGRVAAAGALLVRAGQSALRGGAEFRAEREQARTHRRAGCGSGGTLDYVAAWFIKAGEYLRESDAHIGFVATNSITQGEQVGAALARAVRAAGAGDLVCAPDIRMGIRCEQARLTFMSSSSGSQARREHRRTSGLFSLRRPRWERRPRATTAVLSPIPVRCQRLADQHMWFARQDPVEGINGMPRLQDRGRAGSTTAS